MANVLHETPWSLVGIQTDTIAIPATTAGSTIIVTSGGGAIISARMTNASGAAFDKRTTYGGGELDVSVQDHVCAGGETAVYLSGNGVENSSGHIFEVEDLGAFIAGSAQNNGTGTDPALADNYRLTTSAASALSSGKAVLVGVFASRGGTAINRHIQQGPFGKGLHSNLVAEGTANGKANFFMTSMLADISADKSYPEDLAAGQYQVVTQDYTVSKGFAAQAMYADTSGQSTVTAANPVARENTLPGVARQNWNLGGQSVNEGTIAGFTDKASYVPGETVNFKVDSSSNAYRLELYRVGHYGVELNGARNVLGHNEYLTGTPAVQPAATVDATTGAASCAAWSVTDAWAIPEDACPGLYAVIMRRQDAGNEGKFYQTHFIVRDADITGKVAVVLPDFTWQAYNTWGATSDNGTRSGGIYTGRSLYELGVDGNFAHRAYAVSFDRPYATLSMRGNTGWYDSEQPWIVFAEAQGYDLTYLSMADLDADTTLLNDAKAVVLIGHSEYWSEGAYDCALNAMDAGVNFVIQSSNTALWRVRFDAADTDRRTMICYKDSATVDTGATTTGPGFTGTGRDPDGYTGTWRDTRTATAPNNPDVRRENAMTGQMFGFNAGVAQPVKVQFDKKALPMWRNNAAVQALASGGEWTTPLGIGLGVLGDEADWPDGSSTEPTNMVKLSATTFSSADEGDIASNDQGTIYGLSFPARTMSFTVYRRPSGALIFNTGAWRGSWGTCRYWGSFQSSYTPDVNWQNSWLAIMFDMGMVPTTLQPSQYLDAMPIDPAVGAPGPTRDDVATAYGLAAPSSAPRIWDGTTWQVPVRKVWDGSAWADAYLV